MITKNFKNTVAAAALILCASGAVNASDINNDNNAPIQRVQAAAPAESKVAVEEGKKSPVLDKIKIAGQAVLAHADPIKKEAGEAVEEFKKSKTAYEELCENHKGELKWYHKVKYGIMAFAAPVIKAIKTIVEHIVVPIIAALSEVKTATA